MIVLKIVGIIAGLFIGTIYIVSVISLGVTDGLKNYFKNYTKTNKEVEG
jgi:hypothetical protein